MTTLQLYLEFKHYTSNHTTCFIVPASNAKFFENHHECSLLIHGPDQNFRVTARVRQYQKQALKLVLTRTKAIESLKNGTNYLVRIDKKPGEKE